tara:strand:+ start:5280 stop:5867 length:588 start_codon:yes stop_codon:yes gene_type:complete
MFSRMDDVFESFFSGEFVIVLDEHREVEADFFVLAEHITPKKINFLQKSARGKICVACDPSILNRLSIPIMWKQNQNPHGTNFTIPVDARHNISTGVSASDRAETIGLLARTDSKPSDLVRPGHTSVLWAQDPKKRFGHTEASVQMAKKGHSIPAVVICEILNDDGERADLAFLKKNFPDSPITSLNRLKSNLGF